MLETWPKPDMSLINENRKPAPVFPLELLPIGLQSWVKLSAGAKGCSVDFIAHALLITAAGMIGNARRASPWQDWDEPTILWGALVGLPSTGKSPAVDTVVEPIRTLEAEGAEKYKESLREHEGQCAAAKCHEENWQNAVKDAVKAGKPPPAKPADAIMPEQPPRPRLVITDATSEKAAYLLSKTPKGLLLYRDELSGLLENLERRGGSDRSFYLEAHGGRSYPVDRVKHPEPIIIPSLAISIIGGIQPDKLNTLLMKGDDDGLAARFLYTWPEAIVFQRPTSFADSAVLQRVFRRLNTLQLTKDRSGKPISIIIHFEEKAASVLEEWRREQPEKEAGTSGLLRSHIGKMPGLALRLSSTLCHLEWALSEECQPEPGMIAERHILSAIGLLDGYYLPMAQRCFGDASLPQDQRDAVMVARWIIKEKLEMINAYALSRAAGSPLRDKKRLAEALSALEEACWIRSAPARDGMNRGKQRQDYQVNPALWETKYE